ncbi:Protein C-ets-1 [Eumeta japonica]|uniref:Protein C-ets-1 n=1 Tax=Eumeta variegata TaxID=151549 RepID=A0A4C1WGR6_EUMVA|nr:Protein C-ets-1 [Eumeta japonica]
MATADNRNADKKRVLRRCNFPPGPIKTRLLIAAAVEKRLAMPADNVTRGAKHVSRRHASIVTSESFAIVFSRVEGLRAGPESGSRSRLVEIGNCAENVKVNDYSLFTLLRPRGGGEGRGEFVEGRDERDGRQSKKLTRLSRTKLGSTQSRVTNLGDPVRGGAVGRRLARGGRGGGRAVDSRTPETRCRRTSGRTRAEASSVVGKERDAADAPPPAASTLRTDTRLVILSVLILLLLQIVTHTFKYGFKISIPNSIQIWQHISKEDYGGTGLKRHMDFEQFDIIDPRQWSEAAVAAWLRWATREFSLEGVALQQFARLQGKDICAMGRDAFVARAPAFMGDILWEHLEILQKDVEKDRSLLANVPPNMYESNVCLPELPDYLPPPAHHYNNNNNTGAEVSHKCGRLWLECEGSKSETKLVTELPRDERNFSVLCLANYAFATQRGTSTSSRSVGDCSTPQNRVDTRCNESIGGGGPLKRGDGRAGGQ